MQDGFVIESANKHEESDIEQSHGDKRLVDITPLSKGAQGGVSERPLLLEIRGILKPHEVNDERELNSVIPAPPVEVRKEGRACSVRGVHHQAREHVVHWQYCAIKCTQELKRDSAADSLIVAVAGTVCLARLCTRRAVYIATHCSFKVRKSKKVKRSLPEGNEPAAKHGSRGYKGQPWMVYSAPRSTHIVYVNDDGARILSPGSHCGRSSHTGRMRHPPPPNCLNKTRKAKCFPIVCRNEKKREKRDDPCHT